MCSNIHTPEVNATKLAPAVLVCIMALAVISGIGFALSQNIAQMAEEASGKEHTAVNKALKVWIQKVQLAADPIGDPIPNKHIRA